MITVYLTWMRMKTKGQVVVRYPKFGDKIIVWAAESGMYNMFTSDRYLHHFGVVRAKNATTGDTLEIYMKEKQFMRPADSKSEGVIRNSKGKVMYTIRGDWKSHIDFVNAKTGKVVPGLRLAPFAPKHQQNYCHPLITRNGAHINQSYLKNVCPTDTRFRPDQRAIAFGDMELATKEKVRVEDMQRERRKQRKRLGKKWKPRWFKHEYDEDVGDKVWKYQGGYFEKRKEGDWGTDFPKLF